MNAQVTVGDTVELHSVLLGPLDLGADTIVTFPAAIPGFPELRRFALVETQRDDLVWMQSVDDAGVTLLLTDPFRAVPGFEIELPAADMAAFGPLPVGDALLVLAVVQLNDGSASTANLQSPIVIDRVRCVGRQVVLPESRYGMHHAITLD
jgi:flagellar assembly factor FliW